MSPDVLLVRGLFVLLCLVPWAWLAASGQHREE